MMQRLYAIEKAKIILRSEFKSVFLKENSYSRLEFS